MADAPCGEADTSGQRHDARHAVLRGRPGRTARLLRHGGDGAPGGAPERRRTGGAEGRAKAREDHPAGVPTGARRAEDQVPGEGVTGRAVLKNNGGHYEDVYVRNADGSWRFKSRVHVADAR